MPSESGEENNPNTLVSQRVRRKISGNFTQSSPFMEWEGWGGVGGWGAHDMPAAEGLARSAERHSMPHCSSLLATCFFPSDPPRRLIGAGQNPNPPSPPTQRLPKFFNQLPPAVMNCRGWCQNDKKTFFLQLFHVLCGFKQSSG